jgi:hypothetical protein
VYRDYIQFLFLFCRVLATHQLPTSKIPHPTLSTNFSLLNANISDPNVISVEKANLRDVIMSL